MLLIQSSLIYLICFYFYISVNFVVIESIYVDKKENVINEWIKFIIYNEKKYGSGGESIRRFKIFKQNLKQIEEHNLKYEKGEESFSMGVNQFSDKLQDEYVHETNCLNNDFIE